MQIKIITHGVVAEIIGKRSMVLHDIKNLKTLENHLQDNYPKLKEYTYQYAVNCRFVNSLNKALKNNDEITVIPPFAGG